MFSENVIAYCAADLLSDEQSTTLRMLCSVISDLVQCAHSRRELGDLIKRVDEIVCLLLRDFPVHLQVCNRLY